MSPILHLTLELFKYFVLHATLKQNFHQLVVMGDRRMLHFTSKWFELVLQIKHLFPEGGQIQSESGADGELLDGSAELKDLVCDGLLSWT